MRLEGVCFVHTKFCVAHTNFCVNLHKILSDSYTEFCVDPTQNFVRESDV
jgi:hypothetical protein